MPRGVYSWGCTNLVTSLINFLWNTDHREDEIYILYFYNMYYIGPLLFSSNVLFCFLVFCMTLENMKTFSAEINSFLKLILHKIYWYYVTYYKKECDHFSAKTSSCNLTLKNTKMQLNYIVLLFPIYKPIVQQLSERNYRSNDIVIQDILPILIQLSLI